MAAAAFPTAELSEYEKMVAENVRRNRAVMEALGLCRNDACKHEELRQANAPAKYGKKPSKRSKLGADVVNGPEVHREAVRRSQRLAGLAEVATAEDTEISPLTAGKRTHAAQEVGASEHKAAREAHLRWAGSQRGASIVGSASYEHTLHRVLTMNEAQLARRMHAIERACGQHAVVKMKLFASVLALEGYTELAEEATAAYHRLVEKLGQPESAGGEDKNGASHDVDQQAY